MGRPASKHGDISPEMETALTRQSMEMTQVKSGSMWCGHRPSTVIICAIGLGLLFVNFLLTAILLGMYDNNDTTKKDLQPPLVGIMDKKTVPTIHLAMDVDYPPYAELQPPAEDLKLGGFGPDVARGIAEQFPDRIKIVLTETRWANCWGGGEIGPGNQSGWFHGCMTYTNVKGQRQRFMEFSHSILTLNKPAGILCRMTNGVPAVDGNSNLSGLKIADVNGWAPTADTLQLLSNPCTDELFSGFELVIPDETTNDAALALLLNGTVDLVYIYADQASHYKKECETGIVRPVSQGGWDCTMWTQFGTTFGYIHTGLQEYMNGGTTLSMHKMGNGINDILNPLIEEFMKTEAYYDLCVKYDLVSSCFDNSFFPEGATDKDYEASPYFKPTDELPSSASCDSGYCHCPS